MSASKAACIRNVSFDRSALSGPVSRIRALVPRPSDFEFRISGFGFRIFARASSRRRLPGFRRRISIDAIRRLFVSELIVVLDLFLEAIKFLLQVGDHLHLTQIVVEIM